MGDEILGLGRGGGIALNPQFFSVTTYSTLAQTVQARDEFPGGVAGGKGGGLFLMIKQKILETE